MAKERKGFLAGAYHLRGPADNKRHYDGWAPTYDAAMVEYDYVAPRLATGLLARHFADTAAAILDCGCGTGLGAAALQKHGFGLIDGVDISEQMIEKARGKNLYRRLQTADLIAGLPFADDAYGATLSVGTFTVGHVPPEALPELFRVTRPGGIVTLTVNEMVYEKEEYPAKLAAWAQEKKITVAESLKDAYIRETATGGFYLALRVL